MNTNRPVPYFRSQRRSWCLQLGKDQITLGRHPDHLPEPKRGKSGWNPPEEIMREYFRVMAERDAEKPNSTSTSSEHASVVEVYRSYLKWLRARIDDTEKAERTYEWYLRYVQSFVKFCHPDDGRVGHLTIDKLGPVHVYAWCDSYPGWKKKRGAMIAVQRPLAWAAKAGLLKSVGGTSPLANLEKPQQGRREQLVTPVEFADILSVLICEEGRDLLTVAWNTGMRPHELYSFEARFVDVEAARITFPIRLSKGRKVQRVVYLNDEALAVVRKLVPLRPSGPVMRNTDGRPWNMSSTNCMFQRVRVNLGRRKLESSGLIPPKVPRLKPADRSDKLKRAEQERAVLDRRERIRRMAWEAGTKYSIYAMRHAFCTEALVNGLDAVTVSVLMGHRDTTMISRHYSHVDQQQDHMRQAAKRAKGS